MAAPVSDLRGVRHGAAADTRRRIITPEAVVLEFETASVASRLLARFVDGLVLWVMLFAVAFVLGAGGPTTSDAVAVIVLVVILFFTVFGYWILFETLLRGRTVGKMALGLRVVTVEGAPVRFRHSAIRAMLGLVDFLVPPLGPVAVISVLLNPRDQRLGDMAAGTIVIRERSAAGQVATLNLSEPVGQEALIGRLRLARLDDVQHGIVRRFLLRTATLTPDARAELAASLARVVEQESGVARPPELHPEWYLHAVGIAHERMSQVSTAAAFGPAPGRDGRRSNPLPPPPPPPPGRQ